jgi:F-type H+-transporting ATPase subunit epsilon
LAELLRLTVLTPAETLLDVEEVAWAQVRLADGGGIGIYPGHAPLLAETVSAPLRYADRSGEHTLDLEAGILQVDRGGVTVLTSGVSQTSEDSDELGRAVSQPSETLAEVSEGAHFDRLLQELLATVQACPQGVLDADDEEA